MKKYTFNLKQASAQTFIRTAVLLLALANQILAAFGISPIPVGDEQLSELINSCVTVAAALWAWWKNNSFTEETVEADVYLEALRSDETGQGEL